MLAYIRRRKGRKWAIPAKSAGRGPFRLWRRHEPLEVDRHYGAFPDTTGNEMGHACAAMMSVDTA